MIQATADTLKIFRLRGVLLVDQTLHDCLSESKISEAYQEKHPSTFWLEGFFIFFKMTHTEYVPGSILGKNLLCAEKPDELTAVSAGAYCSSTES